MWGWIWDFLPLGLENSRTRKYMYVSPDSSPSALTEHSAPLKKEANDFIHKRVWLQWTPAALSASTGSRKSSAWPAKEKLMLPAKSPPQKLQDTQTQLNSSENNKSATLNSGANLNLAGPPWKGSLSHWVTEHQKWMKWLHFHMYGSPLHCDKTAVTSDLCVRVYSNRFADATMAGTMTSLAWNVNRAKKPSRMSQRTSSIDT